MVTINDVDKLVNTRELVVGIKSYFHTLSVEEITQIVNSVRPWENKFTFEVAGQYCPTLFLKNRLSSHLKLKRHTNFQVIKGNIRFNNNEVVDYKIGLNTEIVVIFYDIVTGYYHIYGENSDSIAQKISLYEEYGKYINKKLLDMKK